MTNLNEVFKHTFEPQLIQELEKNGRIMSFSQGETIMDIGQIVRMVPILLKGTIKVTRMDDEGREILLYFVSGVESCAMTFSCCMQLKPSEIRAVAEENCLLLTIPVHLMDEWLMKYTTWKSFVMQTMINRFNELLKTIDSIAFQKLDERLISYLKDRAKNAQSTLLNVTHQQIADELATSRVVISRLLKKLENDEKILLYRNQIKLLNAFMQS
jgi:CRP/FNR family transcriptional regulator